MTKQEANKAAQTEMHEFQIATLLPATKLPKNYYGLLSAALMDISCAELQATTEALASISTKQDHYNLWQVANQIRILKAAKPSILGFSSPAKYIEFLTGLDEIMEYFNSVTKPKQEELKAKYDALIEEDEAKENPAGKVVTFPVGQA